MYLASPSMGPRGTTKYCVCYKTKISPLLSSKFCSLHSHQIELHFSTFYTLRCGTYRNGIIQRSRYCYGDITHDGCSITAWLRALTLHLDDFRWEKGLQSLVRWLFWDYTVQELDLDNSSERTCFLLPLLARSPNLFLAFGHKTEEVSRCRLTRLLFWWTGKGWLLTALSSWKFCAGIFHGRKLINE